MREPNWPLERHGSGSSDVVLKRHGSESSDVVLKRRRSVSSVELLPHDVVELILERLPVKSLRSFRLVSKKWRWTVDSRPFQERQWIRRNQSRGPDALFVSVFKVDEAEIVLGSCFVRTVKFPFNNLMVGLGTCDGLVCLYCMSTQNVVVNPATQWHRTFPYSSFQQRIIKRDIPRGERGDLSSHIGFGKDKLTGTYKPVWLYNSSEFGLDNVTTCEVFDFGTNAWRYVVPASPYQILRCQKPVYLDGSLYWLTDCEQGPKVLSFDLHLETFQVLCKAPFAHHVTEPFSVILCILDNRLCVSENNWPTQVIWSLDSSSSKTWKKLCSIDLTKTLPWFKKSFIALLPVAILDKDKLLLHGCVYKQPLVLHDLHTKSYDLALKITTLGHCLHYFESLFSV